MTLREYIANGDKRMQAAFVKLNPDQFTLQEFVQQKETILNILGNNGVYQKIYEDLREQITQDIKNNNENNEIFQARKYLPLELDVIRELKVRDFQSLTSQKFKAIPDYTFGQLFNLNNLDITSLNRATRVRVEDLTNHIKNNPLIYLDYYNTNIALNTLPSNYDENMTIGEAVFAALEEYANLLSTTNERDATIFRMFFGLNEEKSYMIIEKIGQNYDLTADRIYQILFNEKGLNLYNLFIGSQTKNIKIQSNLIIRLNLIKEKTLYKHNFKDLISPDNNLVDEAVKRIANLIRCDITKKEEKTYLIRAGETGLLNEHYRAFEQTIKDKLFPLTFHEIAKLVQNEMKEKFQFNDAILFSLLERDYRTDKIEIEYSVTLHQCKWEYLSTDRLKIQRILVDEFRQMKKQEIIDEYNNRANYLGLSSFIEFRLTQDENFKLCGGNGNWVYAKVYENSNINPDQSITEFLEQFLISQDGKATYSEILEAVKEIGIFIHDKKSIRTTLFNIASLSSNNDDLFIHSDYETQYPDIKLFLNRQLHLGHKFILKLIEILKDAPLNKISSKSLLPEIIERLNADEVTISNGNCSQYLRLFIDDEESIIREIIENGQRFIILNIEKLAICNLDRIGKQKEKEHITTIRSSAINYLKTIEGGKSQKIDILESIKAKGEYPAHLKSDSIFYKILRDESIFETTTFDGISYVQLRADKEIVKKPFAEEIENEIIEKEIIVDSINQPQIQQQYIQRLPYNWEQIRSSFTTELYYYRLEDSILIQGANSLFKALHVDNQIDFWGNQFLQTISNLWFYQTDKYDRHIYLRTMANDYETFLKRFELSANSTTGLSTVIESIPVLYDLRNYDETCRIKRVENYDRTKRSFSIIINKLISLRNKSTHNASHPIFDMGMSSQTKTIADFIALYVYTAYLLNK